jgi:putative heme iron utilization protein
MNEPSPTPAEAKALAIADAKRLMRASRTGALATLDFETGQPLATLVGVASDLDGAPLFLLSELSRHTRNLGGDARASLLLTSVGGRGDPLNQPRLTLGGPVAAHADANAKQRYLRRNPKATLYASFADFSLRRMRIESVHFNGGFGRAAALTVAELLTQAGDVAGLVAAEDELLKGVDALGDAALAKLAEGASSGRRVWRAAGLDAEGLDLSAGTLTARVQFAEPEFTAVGWRRRLLEALEAPPAADPDA